MSDGALQLRRITTAVRAALGEAIEASTAEISAWLDEWFAPRSPQAMDAFIATWEGAWSDGSGYGFVVEDETGRCLGVGFINHVNRRHRFANLGYWIRADAVGRGHATAVTRLLADFGFRELGLKRLELVIEPGNVASQRVAEKAGAIREGLLRNRLFMRDRPCDAVMYALVPA